MTTRTYSGERRVDAIDPRDRGLAYGDGVFETILVHQGAPVWWDAHMARLKRGCEVLGITTPDADFLRTESGALVAGCVRGVLKLVITRGVGERGYAPTRHASPTLLLSLSGAPPPPPRDGLVLRWCDTRLSIQPRLAGIKHLNRLEQVLARAEWSGAVSQWQEIDEGLMCDTNGRVVCATSANLFILRDGRWLTPPVADCGIAGICCGWILQHVTGAAEVTLTSADLELADAIVLCNSVRGILSVAALEERSWRPHPRTLSLQQQLASDQPAFGAGNAANDSLEDA